MTKATCNRRLINQAKQLELQASIAVSEEKRRELRKRALLLRNQAYRLHCLIGKGNRQ